MIDPLADSRYSIDHAQREIQDLEREIAGFSESRPYAIVIEIDPNTGGDLHKIKLTKPLPPALPGIVSDALCAMRDSLDQAGFITARAHGHGSGSRAKFPFGDTLAEVQGARRSRSKDVPKEIFDAMVALKPYEGGNPLLWAVNKLCNAKKHEITIPVALITGWNHVIGPPIKTWPPVWDSAKDEMIIAAVPHGETVQYNFQVHVQVAIGPVGKIARQRASSFLRVCLGEVTRALTEIEREARRIGLFT